MCKALKTLDLLMDKVFEREKPKERESSFGF